MKTEIEVSRGAVGCYSTRYFSERAGVCDHGIQLCVKGVWRYVKLPRSTMKITICFFKRRVAESFEIGRRYVKRSEFSGNSLLFDEIRGYCLADHPTTTLLQSFRSELYRYYINGYKFFRIEY